ncbi:hypothetical protein TNCV_330821 [Trichonephila clavipes]|nr:hypothetical protein TNCV_330821 [Trichonephila clavipes]
MENKAQPRVSTCQKSNSGCPKYRWCDQRCHHMYPLLPNQDVYPMPHFTITISIKARWVMQNRSCLRSLFFYKNMSSKMFVVSKAESRMKRRRDINPAFMIVVQYTIIRKPVCAAAVQKASTMIAVLLVVL